jgi:hypothetical protein
MDLRAIGDVASHAVELVVHGCREESIHKRHSGEGIDGAGNACTLEVVDVQGGEERSLQVLGCIVLQSAIVEIWCVRKHRVKVEGQGSEWWMVATDSIQKCAELEESCGDNVVCEYEGGAGER